MHKSQNLDLQIRSLGVTAGEHGEHEHERDQHLDAEPLSDLQVWTDESSAQRVVVVFWCKHLRNGTSKISVGGV